MRFVPSWIRRAIVLPAFLAAASLAHAQSYPDKPVRVIVPFPAGATLDYVVRLVSQRLGEDWGQQFIVENRTGGAGIIGTDALAKSAPDGYTIASVANSFAANPTLRQDLPYDTARDFAPITLIGSTPLILVGHPSVTANTTAELVTLAKQRPGKLSYGAAVGASPHMAMAWFVSVTGVDMALVPYRGQAQAQTDLLAGQIQLVFGNLPDVMPHVRAGKMKAYGIATAARSPLAPQIPTLAEAGYKGPEWDSWYGFVAPAKTPKEIVDKVALGVKATLARPDIREKLLGVGLQPVGGTPEEFRAFLAEKNTSYAKIIKEAGIRAE
ncbi:MAG: tripartite tricarboxylate transporter substrate binding protein [Betaproteobacteria bacterium]